MPSGGSSINSSKPNLASLEKRVKKIISDQLGLEERELNSKLSFVDDLGADSLDIVELIMALEEEFEMEIPDEHAEKIITVKDAVEYVKQHVQ